jgi:hypothetical protein
LVPILHSKTLRKFDPTLLKLASAQWLGWTRTHTVAAIANVVFVRRILSSAENLWKEAGEEDTHAGHAGADDANVDFDCRPLSDEEVIPRRIGGLGEMDKGLKAENTDNCDATN